MTKKRNDAAKKAAETRAWRARRRPAGCFALHTDGMRLRWDGETWPLKIASDPVESDDRWRWPAYPLQGDDEVEDVAE